MNQLFSKVQLDLNKLQKTLEHEGEVLLSKIMEAASKAAQNEKIVAKKQEIEKLVGKQIERFEPVFDRFYQDLKHKIGKYGFNLDKIGHNIKTTTEQAAIRLHLKTKTTAKAAKKQASNSSKKNSPVGNRKKAKKKV